MVRVIMLPEKHDLADDQFDKLTINQVDIKITLNPLEFESLLSYGSFTAYEKINTISLTTTISYHFSIHYYDINYFDKIFFISHEATKTPRIQIRLYLLIF